MKITRTFESNGARLFALSLLSLFFELALIRFASAEIIYLGYFSHFILISAFLGLGLGFLAAERKVRLFKYLPQAMLLLVAFVLGTHANLEPIAQMMGQLFFTMTTHAPDPSPLLWIAMGALFLISTFVFASFSQEMAFCFRDFPPLRAYSIDIAGALAGTILFTLESYSCAGPIYWFLICFSLIVVLSFRYSVTNAIAMGAGILLLLSMNVPSHYSIWSPYQKVEVEPTPEGPVLGVNGIFHQNMFSPGSGPPQYEFPYRVIPNKDQAPYRKALIIGAGSGSDVAYAVHHGVPQIDAVEIDPEIQQAGILFHPSHPYDAASVHAIVDDGRSFMARSHEQYDLIIFALPDSLALVSGQSNIRLESFLFTVEAFEQAKRLLAEDGVFVLYNYFRRPWLIQKLAGMLEAAFGHPPVVMQPKDSPGYMAFLAIGPKLGGYTSMNASIDPATDNWPFLYMEKHQLPPMYVLAMMFFVLSAVGGVVLARNNPLPSLRLGAPFFLMGTAFLLLETKSIVQFSLLFGSVWLVNSMVFTAILLSVLLANVLALKITKDVTHLIFYALILSLAANYFIPIRDFLRIEQSGLRYVLASAFLFSPVFLANLAFGMLFKNTKHATTQMGWNILGTVLGGTLEYTALVFGYRALTLIAAVLYLSAYLWARFWVTSKTSRS